MKKISYIYVILLLFAFVRCRNNERAEKLIVDAGYLLSNDQEKHLNDLITQIDKKGNCSIFLYTVIAEEYYSRSNYSEYVFRLVSKGDSVMNKNILLYFSYNDRKIQIRTGNKSSEVLTDSLCNVLINNIVPYFYEKQYYQGITTAINYIDSTFMKNATNAK